LKFPYLTWDINKSAKVRSLAELRQWIKLLTQKAAEEKKAFSVQLHKTNETGILFTVGLDICHLEYFSKKGTPIVVGCRGPWASDEVVTFIHGDEPSELEKRYFVPMEDAFQAIEYYYAFEEKPNNIQWGE